MIPARHASRARTTSLLVTLVASWSCSNASSHEGYAQALRSVEEAISGPTQAWADAVAITFQAQLDTTREVVPDQAVEAAAPKADAVIDVGCKEIEKHTGALKKEVDVPGVPRLGDFPRIELAKAIGRFPKQLYATKPTWPDDWLLSPGRQPDYTAPLSAFEPGFFKGYLKPQFVAVDGSVVFPPAGDPQFPNFKGLLYNSKELLGNRIGYQTSRINEGLRKCLPMSR